MKGSPMQRNFGIGSPVKNDKSSAASNEYVVEDYAYQHGISEEEVKRHLENLSVAEGDTMLSVKTPLGGTVDKSHPDFNTYKVFAAFPGRYATQKDWRQTDNSDVDDSYPNRATWDKAVDKWHKSIDWNNESTSSTGETFFSVPKFTFHGSNKSQMSKKELKQYYKQRGF